jgi:hypothetical protein
LDRILSTQLRNQLHCHLLRRALVRALVQALEPGLEQQEQLLAQEEDSSSDPRSSLR